MKFTAQRLLLSVIGAALVAMPPAGADDRPLTGPQTEARFPPLKVPPGFKATLFACDPLIEYPSAISAGPRPGAIFVAVDYMTGLGTEVVRRSEVRLVEDSDGDSYADRAPAFAAHFNSIQGLAWHNGSLYVMHSPFLTVLRDTQGTGKADQRRNLLSGLGLTPEENPVRLHCANGVTVGHDGWLYLALGDHGCNVLRPEGDRLVLEGGGILRCRLDGRDLHVFSTGLRNIYDVALDEELNVFVRDNENDGGTYKIRVSHSFHGADHGYPYLYEHRPDEALPPLADLGLGSSAGGVCYLEAQLPEEYRGNLLFCEWGRAVIRYPLAPRGSSFATPPEIEFAAGAREDPYGFKPTDVVVQRDGTLMISDYADGQRPKRGRGRIYKIAYIGEAATPEPQALALDADSELWLTRLDSQSYFQRCDAQQAIQRQGQSGLKRLAEALSEKKLGVRGRLHSIWIIAHGNAPSAIDDLLRIARSDPEPSVRAQAIRAIGDLADPVLTADRLDAGPGDGDLAAQLALLGSGEDSQVLLEVMVALGRLRWATTADWLRENLANPDAALAHAAMQALRKSQNWHAILKLLDAPLDERLQAIALRSLAERYEAVVVDGLIERLPIADSASRRSEYAELLARVYKKPGAWVYWGFRPPPRPANTVEWERSEAIAAALDGVLADSARSVRLSALKHMQREKIPMSMATLSRWLADEFESDRVAAILTSLRDQPAVEARPHLKGVIKNPQHSIANRQTALAVYADALDARAAAELLELCRTLEAGPVLANALRLMGKYPELPAKALLLHKLDSPAAEVRAAALEAVADLSVKDARQRLLSLLDDPDAGVRRAAADAAGKLLVNQAREPLLKLVNDTDPAVRRASFGALRLLREERAIPPALAALADRHVNLQALTFLGELAGPEQAGAVAELAKRDPSTEIITASVRVLANWRNRAATVSTHQQELDRAVAEIQGAHGIVVQWQASGAVPADAVPLLVEQLASSGTIVGVSGWPTVLATGTEARVQLAPKETAKDGVWLAHSAVHVGEPTAVEFLSSSSGGFHVWLNGQSVYRRREARAYRIDSDRFSVTLAKGDNRLVVMVEPSQGAAEFHLRFRRKSTKVEHERLTQAALARAGDPQAGRRVLLDVEKSLCLKCHRLGNEGERTGPELTGVGSRFSRIYLIESILDPGRTIAPSFGTVSVLLSSGQVLSGVKSEETETTVTLADNQGQKHLLMKAEIEEQKASPVSTMPEGLEKRLTEREFIDLIAFLSSLKE